MKNSKRLLAVAVSAALAAPLSAYATNGMNLEGYGPIATGMGGASMAYDNGTAGMMNNPATIGLAEDGNRLDVAWGFLGPNVDAEFGTSKWASGGDAYNMPAIGWVQNHGKLAYGAGGFAQGGMGTEYKPSATQPAPGPAFFFVPPSQHPFGGSMGGIALSPTSAAAATVMGWQEKSEVGVMRVLFPLSYQVNSQLNIGGSIDYVRASLDLQMAMDGAMMADMMDPTKQTIGTLSGSMTTALNSSLGTAFTDVYGGYFDFADNNPYSGKTTGDGFAGKIGFTYKVDSNLSIGGTYHSQSSLSDLSGDAQVTMAVAEFGGAGQPDGTVTMNGKIKIKDFQWPQTFGLGMAYRADKLMIAADVKYIKWADVMKDFKMSFTAAGNAGTPAAGFDGTTLDAVMYQNWDNQTVVELGGAYQATDRATVRLGVNVANNPIPDATLHYLFPAIVKTHYTVGFGYTFSMADELNFSATYAPEVKQTNGMGMTITHSQTNWQLMYSHSF